MRHAWLTKPQNFERVPLNLYGKLIHGSFQMLPNVTNVWFPCKCVIHSQIDWFFSCICLRATRTSSMDEIICCLEMDMAKEICKLKTSTRGGWSIISTTHSKGG